VNEEDVAFEHARLVAPRSWADLSRRPAFARALERHVRSYVFRDTAPFAVGACSPTTCERRRIEVRVFIVTASSAIDDDDFVDPVHGAPLHACVGTLCDAEPPMHALECTSALERNCRLVYVCARHGRVHVCDDACRHNVAGPQGYRVCALSGRTLSAPLETAFGDGNTVLSDTLVSQREHEETVRRTSSTLRRSAAHVLESIIASGNAQLRDSATLGTTPTSSASAADADEDVYVDVDIPADDVFPDAGVDNTFGDAVSADLARLYAQAYSTVHLLLFSEQRAAIERRAREDTMREAQRHLNTYIANQRKTGAPIMLAIGRRLERRAFNARRLFPELLVPPHTIARLTAYYAVVCVELYVQLVAVVAGLRESLSAANRQVAQRFMEMPFASIAPTMLDILHEGLHASGVVLVIAEPTLSLFPESQTIEELGVPQKTCTQVKKDLKRLVVVASQANVPLTTLRTTQLDMATIMHGRTSIISTFLAERRRRLSLL